MSASWIKNDYGDGEYIEAPNVLGGYRKLQGVRVDGYFASVTIHKVSQSGRFATAARAKSWVHKKLSEAAG